MLKDSETTSYDTCLVKSVFWSESIFKQFS